MPIAAGEVLTRRQSFLPWIERRAVDYIQPDVTKVGGITEEHRIGQYADDHTILLRPARLEHGGRPGRRPATGRRGRQRPLGGVHHAVALHRGPLARRRSGSTRTGMLSIPDGPGLGFRWNPDGIAKHTGGQFPVDLRINTSWRSSRLPGDAGGGGRAARDAAAALAAGAAGTKEWARGRGIATALLRRGLAHARAAGYCHCLTDWRSPNLLASRFWPWRGFQPVAYRLARRVDPRIAWAGERA